MSVKVLCSLGHLSVRGLSWVFFLGDCKTVHYCKKKEKTSLIYFNYGYMYRIIKWALISEAFFPPFVLSANNKQEITLNVFIMADRFILRGWRAFDPRVWITQVSSGTTCWLVWLYCYYPGQDRIGGAMTTKCIAVVWMNDDLGPSWSWSSGAWGHPRQTRPRWGTRQRNQRSPLTSEIKGVSLSQTQVTRHLNPGQVVALWWELGGSTGKSWTDWLGEDRLDSPVGPQPQWPNLQKMVEDGWM